ncbi:MAG: hypothetical protein ACLFR7_11020 [Opitutales bacterium]
MTLPADPFATKKKPMYKPGPLLMEYLARYNRLFELPVSYSRLLEWHETMPLFDDNGEDTLWRTLIYRPEVMKRLNKHLTGIYAMLKTEGDISFTDHLYVDRIDYCTFGNSNPFRIRIVNSYNDNQDYYYLKKLDASRIYGLEFEHLLSPNRMHYLIADDILVEEHVVGVPGDQFIEHWMGQPHLKKIRLAKELVKFNERCFVRLLGDMRSYNFVVDMTPDFEEVQIRIRSMDFDQQSYSGRINFYRPQFFKENNKLVQFCIEQLNVPTATQYQREEQATIFRRIMLARTRVNDLLRCMKSDRISAPEKVSELAQSLATHYQNDEFLKCERMGQILDESLIQIRDNVQRIREQRKARNIFEE